VLRIRSFVDCFDRRHLDRTIPKRTDRFLKFIKMNSNSKKLQAWSLDAGNFNHIFIQLYRKLCTAAHNFFNVQESLIIEDKHLKGMELRIVGYISAASGQIIVETF
jgi:hypothetical protein